jgi:hypothetical protein
MSVRFPVALTGALTLALLTACASPPPAPPAPEGAPAGFPAERYTEPGAGARVYVVDPENSVARVIVRRGGALARLGHDHVIAARDIRGYVRIRDGAVVADLYATLTGMSVDEEALREEAGFATEPSAEDKAGTRANMLNSLDAAQFPYVQVELSAFAGADRNFGRTVDAEVLVTLHGVTRSYRVPVSVELSARSLTAAGGFSVQQSDFGIEPFSVLGGALTVTDTLDIRFRIEAGVPLSPT